MSYLSISPSPFSCFIRLPCCSLTATSRPPSRPWRLHNFLAELFPNRKRRSSALPHERRGVWLPGRSDALHRLWAQRQDHFCRRWHDAHQRSEPRQHLRLLEETNGKTLDCSVFPQCVKPSVSHVSHGDFAQHASRNRFKAERERRERSSVLNVTKKSTEQYWKSFSSDSQRMLFWWTRSPRTPGTKCSRSCYWWKFSSEKIILDWARRGDPKLRAKKFRKCNNWVTAWAWISKTTTLEANQWADQAHRERIHLRSELEMKNSLHQEWYARGCQEIEELRRYAKKENEVTHHPEDEWIFFAAWSRVSNSESITESSSKITRTIGFNWRFKNLPRSWLTQQFWQCSRFTSSFYPVELAANRECSEILERIWVFPETFLIVNLPDGRLRNYTKNQEIWQHHRRFKEEKELRKVGAKNHCNQYLYLAFR